MVTIERVLLLNNEIKSNFKHRIMKRADKSSGKSKNFELFMSKLSENEILSNKALSSVKGGDGVANGGEPVVSIPRPPQS